MGPLRLFVAKERVCDSLDGQVRLSVSMMCQVYINQEYFLSDGHCYKLQCKPRPGDLNPSDPSLAEQGVLRKVTISVVRCRVNKAKASVLRGAGCILCDIYYCTEMCSYINVSVCLTTRVLGPRWITNLWRPWSSRELLK